MGGHFCNEMYKFDKKPIMNNSPYLDIKNIEASILRSNIPIFLLSIVGILTYSATMGSNSFIIISLSVFIILSSFAIGFFTGTLFGMPKRNETNGSNYSLNNSLIEISEWLTKIIVGISLVNLKKIPEYLEKLGQFIYENSGVASSSFKIYTISLIVFFTIFGLYLGYNYMRLVLSQKYKIADDFVVLQRVSAIINEANNTVNISSNLTRDELTISMESLAEQKLIQGSLENPNDPQKNQWGGKAIANDRRIEADIKEFIQGLYRITLRVKSTNSDKPLVEGESILFALHQTFGNPPFKYAKVINGIAELSLFSYGSFTVGALCDHGNTELELDLSKLPGVSAYFRDH